MGERVKACTYCGHEEGEDASHCGGCGTEFAQVADEKTPGVDQDREFNWVRMAVLYLAVCLFGGMLYLLSLGPVMRYCGKVTTTAPIAAPTPTTGTVSVTMVRTIKHPSWVGIVYYPAFKLLSGGSVGDLYMRYLEWWQRSGN